MATFDFSESFKALEKAFTCNSCNTLYEKAVVLQCLHVFCSKCVVTMKDCLLCNSRVVSNLTKPKEIIDLIVEKIKKIQELFEGSESKYLIENLPQNILDLITQSEKYESTPSRTPSTKRDAIVKINNLNNTKTFICPEIGMTKISIINSEVKKNNLGESSLHVACAKNEYAQVDFLIKQGVDVNSKDFGNWTPLHDVVQKNARSFAELLLKGGALVNVPGANYLTPLYQAVDLGYPDMCKLLLLHGADINFQDYFGKTLKNIGTKGTQQLLNKFKKKTVNTEKFFVNPVTDVYYTGKTNVKELKSLNLKIHTNFTNIVNLLILDGSKQVTNKMDLLMGIMNSVMVISEEDLGTFISVGHPLQFNLIPREIKEGLTKSIHNRLLKNPSLFHGINFFIAVGNEPITVNEVKIPKAFLTILISWGGGRMLARAPAERTVDKMVRYPFHARKCEKLRDCCNYIIYDEKSPPALMYNFKELKHLSAQWLIRCIWNYKIEL